MILIFIILFERVNFNYVSPDFLKMPSEVVEEVFFILFDSCWQTYSVLLLLSYHTRLA